MCHIAAIYVGCISRGERNTILMRMKLGLGLYRHQLNAEHYRFAKQCGCTHLVIHLVDYFRSPGGVITSNPNAPSDNSTPRGESRSNQPGPSSVALRRVDDQPCGDDSGWGLAGDPDKLWTFEELAAIKKEINAARPRTGSD